MSGKVVLVQLRDGSWENEKGELFVPADLDAWKPVTYLANPAICGHSETMCDDCVDAWEADYHLNLEPQ